MRERYIHAGDWVRIDCPRLPWFHGQIAEVVHDVYYFTYPNPYSLVKLAISFTPGYTTTNWNSNELILLDDEYERAVETFGEDYFA